MKQVALAIALTLLLSGCAADDDGGDAPVKTPASSATTSGGAAPLPEDLDGRVFRVTGVVDRDVVQAAPPDTEVTLRIDGDQVTGSAGCNTYTASIVRDGDRIQIGAIAITERACADTSDWLAFLDVLGSATALEQAGDGLVINARQERALLLQ